MGEHDCTDVLQRVHDFLDGELTVERRTEIRVHLEACGHCFEAFDFEAELKLAIQETCREQVPDDLMRRLRAALDAEVG